MIFLSGGAASCTMSLEGEGGGGEPGPERAAGGPAISPEEVAEAARSAGVPCGRRLTEAVAVAYAESGWHPTATNYNPGGAAPSSTDHGLWQINDHYWGPFSCDIYDPDCNAGYMVDISDNGSNWRPWHGHGTSLYYGALDEAETAAEAVCSCSSYSGTFSDDDGSVHEGNIEALASAGITSGCSQDPCPQFCPDRDLPRDEMAAFLARALDLPPASEDYFIDDEDNIFAGAINKIAEAGITVGCNPPTNTRFCPDDTVTRAQMASFLARALSLPAASADYFDDDGDSVHEGNINKIAEAGITVGCNPPANTRFCPGENVTRAQMATFLVRALGL